MQRHIKTMLPYCCNFACIIDQAVTTASVVCRIDRATKIECHAQLVKRRRPLTVTIRNDHRLTEERCIARAQRRLGLFGSHLADGNALDRNIWIDPPFV